MSVIGAFVLNNISFTALWFPLYMKQLGRRKWVLVTTNALLLLGQALLYLWLNREGGLDLNGLQLYRLVYFALYLTMLYVLVRENFFKFLFVWFVAASYTNIVVRVATFIEIRFFGGAMLDLYFGRNNLILLCLLAVTLPPMVLFQNRVIMPMVRTADQSVFRFIWLVPGCFLLNFFIYITDLRIEQISNARYLLLIIPLVVGIGVSCYTLMRLLSQAADKARLDAEITAAGRMMDLQRDQYRRLIEDGEKSKAARHDLRHQLAVIQRYLRDGDTDGAVEYCSALSGAVLRDERRIWCENFAVNAVADHYLSQAEGEGVRMEIRLEIPEDAGGIPVMELCVVIGNLLENAVEACRRIPPERRFIHLHSRVWYGKLSITMDNSFDGVWKREGDIYYSAKRKDAGIGLSSVRAVCRKYGGQAEFETRDGTFQSSVMLEMGQAG